MKFGEKVRDLRKKHSLTQDELAQCLGINKRTIIGWERDGRYPRSIEMLEKMADIFHVPLTYTLNKFLTIKDKHILLYEHNAFTSHLMLDSDEVYQMTKRGLDAAQIAAAKGIHLNLVLVKLLELHHLGYDLRHYRAQHHAFIKQFNLPAHFQFDVAAG